MRSANSNGDDAIEKESRFFESAGGTAVAERRTEQLHDDSRTSRLSREQQGSSSAEEQEHPLPTNGVEQAHGEAAMLAEQQQFASAEAGKTSTKQASGMAARRSLFTNSEYIE